MDFCQHCGTCLNNGEKKCETPEQVQACPWMVGVHREVIVLPVTDQKPN